MPKGPFNVDSDTSKRGRKVSDAAIASEIVMQFGNVSAVARVLKMRRGAVLDRINTSANLTLILEENREGIIDDSEMNMFKAVKVGDLTASKFILATIGKNRGYGTRTELTGIDGAPIPIAATVTYRRVKAPDQEGIPL